MPKIQKIARIEESVSLAESTSIGEGLAPNNWPTLPFRGPMLLIGPRNLLFFLAPFVRALLAAPTSSQCSARRGGLPESHQTARRGLTGTQTRLDKDFVGQAQVAGRGSHNGLWPDK